MENEQAMTAVPPTEATPADGVENQRERTLNSLLEEMAPPPTEALMEETPPEASEPESEPEVTPAEEEDEEPRRAKNFRGRWDHLNDEERRVVELTTKRGLTLQEACRAVYGNTPASAEAAPAIALPELEQKIGEQEALLSLRREEKTQAQGDLAAYDEASEAYLEAREALNDLRRQHESALRQQQAAQERERETARQTLAEEFPDALTPGSELYEAITEEVSYLRDTNNPICRDPAFEAKVARRMARALGYQRAPQPTAEPVTPRRTARPVPTGGAPLDAAIVPVERRVAGAQSPDAMLDLMRELGTPFEALLAKA